MEDSEARNQYLRRLEAVRQGARRMGLTATDRHFEKVLFCGAGDGTRHEIQVLHDRLDEAIPYLGGSQQGPRWEVPPTQEMLDAEESMNQEARLVCEQVARDVAKALTGKEITFVE